MGRKRVLILLGTNLRSKVTVTRFDSFHLPVQSGTIFIHVFSVLKCYQIICAMWINILFCNISNSSIEYPILNITTVKPVLRGRLWDKEKVAL